MAEPPRASARGRAAQAAARLAYAALLGVLAPAYLLKLWWRGRAEPLYREAIAERFGRYGDAPSVGCVWVHAVSLGETRAASALVDALRVRRPGLRLLLTHGTATGRAAGRALLREGDRQTWLPYDMAPVVARFLDHFRPAIGILMETEIWPVLLVAARERGVPMVLANARLSERSERRGQRLAPLLAPAVAALDLVLAQSQDDARRLRDVGTARVAVRGNLKFDMTPDAAQLARGRAWRTALGRPVVLAAVTREGEEEMLLAAWRAADFARSDGADADARSRIARSATALRPLLLIVPRHPQRFDAVRAKLRKRGVGFVQRSSGAPPAENDRVFLLDTVGELQAFYAAADIAFVGGTLVPVGGHNLLEPALLGLPILAGPHTHNAPDIARLLADSGALTKVSNGDELARQVSGFLDDPPRAAAVGRRGRSAVEASRGAVDRLIALIEPLLRSSDERPAASSASSGSR